MYFLKQNRFKLTLLFLLTFSYPTQTDCSWFSRLTECFRQPLQLNEALNHLDPTAPGNSAIIINIDEKALYIVYDQWGSIIYIPYVHPEVLGFYREVIRRGYTVILLTAKSGQYLKEIAYILRRSGYDQGPTCLICMPAETVELNQFMRECFNTGSYEEIRMTGKWKMSERKRITEEKGYLSKGRRYTIAMTLDRREEDLRGGCTGATVLIPT